MTSLSALPVLRDVIGMTVAEVIVALFVITVGLVGLMAAMPLSTSHIAEANRKTAAVFLAQQRLEQIKNARWTASPVADTLGGAGSSGMAAVAQWPDEAAIAGYPAFQRQVRIQDCSVAPGCGMALHATLATLRQITVTVRFARMTGLGTLNSTTLETIQLVTYVSRQN
jgi:Tfp pilus assembly protein PilV